jgi:hypothetical protein
VGTTELYFAENVKSALADLSVIEKNAWSDQPVLQMGFRRHQAYLRDLERPDGHIFPGAVISGGDLNVVGEEPASANVETVPVAAVDVLPSTGEFQALG